MTWAYRWALLRNRFLCSRPMLAVAVLLGWPVMYRVCVGAIHARPHQRVVECDIIGQEGK